MFCVCHSTHNGLQRPVGRLSAAILATIMLYCIPSWAQIPEHLTTPAEQGRWIAEESDRRNLGWSDAQVSFKMILKNANNETSERELRLKTLEVADDGDKSLTIFDTPADVKGTAFLTFSHINVADEQWMYLPALKRVKRITSKNKSGPFMGSTFAFEDLSSFEVDKYTYHYLDTEQLNGESVYVSELTPVYKHSGYSKMKAYLDTAEFRVQKILYYDRKGALLKTQTFADYKQYLDKYWRAHQTLMVNHQTQKSTELQWSDYQFQVGLTEKEFNKNVLKRLR